MEGPSLAIANRTLLGFSDPKTRNRTCGAERQMRITRSSNGFTAVELLVVISIVTILAAIALPALSAARESARASACRSNLRQFGVGMTAFSDRHKRFCTGAFSWKYDGAVTELGWVADLASQGNQVGSMLCPSNTAQLSETYADLLNATSADLNICTVNVQGSAPQTLTDGSTVSNPCRQILSTPLAPGSAERRELVQTGILEAGFNTNYVATWFLVRGGVILDQSGNIKPSSGCSVASARERSCTTGPLKPAATDSSRVPSSAVPLMGCAGLSSKTLSVPLGGQSAGAPLAISFTGGPVSKTTMKTPDFASGTPLEGPTGSWAGWRATLQDYRAFGPVHRNSCNLLFADGSVRNYVDHNADGYLNNGFAASGTTGFQDDVVELPASEIFSGWSLRYFK